MPTTTHLQLLTRTVPATIPKLESSLPARMKSLVAAQQPKTKSTIKHILLSETAPKMWLDAHVMQAQRKNRSVARQNKLNKRMLLTPENDPWATKTSRYATNRAELSYIA